MNLRKFLSLLFVTTSLLAGNIARADMPADAPGKLKDPSFWKRCGAPNGQPDIPISQCNAQTATSRAGGCIDDAEKAYADAHGVMVFCIATTIVSACPCSCFEESTKILTNLEGNDQSWSKVSSLKGGSQIVAPAAGASLANLNFQERRVSYQTAGKEQPELFVIKTDKSTLSVTENHAMLLASGKVIRAKDLKVSDTLVDQKGNSVSISAITRKATSQDVYNVLVDHAATSSEHFVVADGLVVGDLLWQNALRSELDSVVLRQ